MNLEPGYYLELDKHLVKCAILPSLKEARDTRDSLYGKKVYAKGQIKIIRVNGENSLPTIVE